VTAAVLKIHRRDAWRLARAMAPDLGAMAATERESRALDLLLGSTGPGLRVDWVDLAFNSQYGGRFKLPGAYGALYAAWTQHASMQEAVFNWTKAYRDTSAEYPPGTRLVLQRLRLKLTGRFVDVRSGHKRLHDPDSHAASRIFGFRIQSQGWDGIVYRSVHSRPQGTCVAVFRRTAAVSCSEAGQAALVWNGARVGFLAQDG
jgi:hypothetical protein